MKTFICLFVAATTIGAVMTDQSDQGPHTFSEDSQQFSPKYGMKEIIMYLTPSQLSALEDAGILVKAGPNGIPEFSSPGHDQKLLLEPYENEHTYSDSNYQHYNEVYRDENSNDAKQELNYSKDYFHSPQVEEPNVEQDQNLGVGLQQYSSLSEPPFAIPPQHPSYAYIHFSSHGQPDTNIQLFYPQPIDKENDHQLHQEHNFEFQQESSLNQKHRLVPYEYVTEKHEEGLGNYRTEETKQQKQFHRNVKRNSGLKHRRIYKYVQRKYSN